MGSLSPAHSRDEGPSNYRLFVSDRIQTTSLSSYELESLCMCEIHQHFGKGPTIQGAAQVRHSVLMAGGGITPS